MRRWRLVEVLLGEDHKDHPRSTTCRGIFDIIAMEEVDRYHSFFHPILNIFNYDGIFVPKQNSPGFKLGWFSDGCALFWKRDKFELITKVTNSFKVGNQKYIIATLFHRDSGRTIVVAVTHLKAQNNSTCEKIRTQQANELIDSVNNVIHTVASNDNLPTTSIPTILMGDFNSDPDGDEKTCIKSVLSRQPQLSSVYDLERHNFFTTWKSRGHKTARRIIDYIFYNDSKGFRCSHVLSIPKDEQIEATKLPGFRYPSDHLSIGSKFELDSI